MNEIPEELRPLFEAYCKSADVDLSPRSYSRQQTLFEIHARGITADDITLVMTELKRLVASRDPRHDCYRPVSLEWRNAMHDVDRLEDRVERMKREIRRKEAAKPKPQVARTDSTGVSRLDDAPAKEPNVIDLPSALRGLADGIRQSA